MLAQSARLFQMDFICFRDKLHCRGEALVAKYLAKQPCN